MKSRKVILSTVSAAMLTALCVVLTVFAKIPFGAGGYVHLGDMVIYLEAAILPLPYAIISAAVSGCFSDVVSGFATWAPFSLVIKALLVLPFTSKGTKLLCKRNYIAALVGIPITVVGYFFSEVIIYGNWGAYMSIPWNLLQAVVNGALFVVFAKALDKLDFKRRIDPR
ncbi:MAG: TIGR04002 family protein [Clostridiales bacterium]|nr:TIGR04002 family protein [Clostridiales bacterium]